MHVVREKKTKKVLFIDYSMSKKPKKARDVYPPYNPTTMELGWTDQQNIPADFDINKKGEIIPLSLRALIKRGAVKPAPDQKIVKGKIVGKTIEELVKDGRLSIEEVKKNYTERFSHEAFAVRRDFIPDYRLQNAALGIYDEKTTNDYKRTVEAFRKEFYRLQKAVEKARSVRALEAIKPRFPTAIVEEKKLKVPRRIDR